MRPSAKSLALANVDLKILTPEQVVRIDELLKAVGEYGEVHLVVQRGELRYMNKVESYKVWGGEANEKEQTNR